ncbi:hypothetical protein niasHS_009942 [Heterodera schachtii]|uniref:Uncharacterized protein n=1 Tax=Heterodera schachtii TaxID=97005 RepID=A0ABD2JCY1_HETSC
MGQKCFCPLSCRSPQKLDKTLSDESNSASPNTTDCSMNIRFPVESGESLNASSKNVVASEHKKREEANLPVWVYVIFRKNPSSGHEKVSIKDSLDGPVFWSRRVLYVFCCSCHFDRHERDLLRLMEQWKHRIERVCLVDRPLDYPFLPDSLFGFLANHLPQLEFVYLRELDLEKINRVTVERLSQHKRLKKMIVHGCRNYEVLQDFRNLPQLLVVKGDIQGLKAMIGCEEFPLSESISEAKE